MSLLSCAISHPSRGILIRRKNVGFPLLRLLAFTTCGNLPVLMMYAISIPFILQAFLNLTALTHITTRYESPDPLQNLLNGFFT